MRAFVKNVTVSGSFSERCFVANLGTDGERIRMMTAQNMHWLVRLKKKQICKLLGACQCGFRVVLGMLLSEAELEKKSEILIA